MTVINTNVGALMARTYASKAAQNTETSMERLSSGLRINGSADDAAGMAVANKMRSQLNGIKMAIRNSQDGISLVQTAESGMSEISNMILRMRELAVQMENGIYTSKDRDNAQLEVNALLQEVDKIAANTRFNDVNLLDGNYDQTIRAGNTNAETIRIAIDGLKSADVAKIEAHAVEKAVRTADGETAGTEAKPLELTVKEGTVVNIDTSVFSDTFKEFFKADSLGTFSLAAAGAPTDGTADGDDDNSAFTIDAKTGVITSAYVMDFESDVPWSDEDNDDTDTTVTAGGTIGVSDNDTKVFNVQVTYTNRNDETHVETIEMTLADNDAGDGAAIGSQLDDIKVESQAEATRAIETLDLALEEVSSAQAKLGAIQNRLQHNIDNLSKGAMLTEQAVGRVVDADFASETSNLSKQQILNQAATAMLAQANQSKQSVLSLLQ
ncbi:flagellin [Alphaproteobacteria bacterium]|nr:flagellin [Alphaproteobacteria bacterium]